MPLALQVENVSMRFGGVTAITGVNLSVEEREIRCLIGPNGAGKSTLFKIITGQLRPSTGRVLFSGTNITGQPSHRIARLGVGTKTQVPPVVRRFERVRERLAQCLSVVVGSGCSCVGG
jgi:branched-chain amino acid transport system ATP-binding protein